MMPLTLPLVLSLVVMQAAPQVLPGPSCSFAIPLQAPPPEVTGPPNAVKRTRVLPQPESPLRVAGVEYMFVTESGRPGTVRMTLQNFGDQTITGGAVAIGLRTGEILTTAIARLTTSLIPGAVATLSRDVSFLLRNPSVPVDEVLVRVRSVSFETCTFDPPAAEPSAGGSCDFTVSEDTEPPAFAGPADLVARVRLVSQPGSPLRIRRIDLSDLKVRIGDTWAQVRGGYDIEVRNVSNRTIDRAFVALAPRAGRPASWEGASWQYPLRPGKTVRLHHDVAQRGRQRPGSLVVDFAPEVTASGLELQVLAVSVWFEGGCRYEPAQIQRAGWGRFETAAERLPR